MLETIRKTIIAYCLDFVGNPYLCYTEHGQHALFYSMLYNDLPEQQRYTAWKDQKVCVLQKEYPTAGALGKPRRQHWDIAILKSPPDSSHSGPGAYDFLRLYAAIEFGMNESEEHLIDDISRLTHIDANVDHAFIVHQYRLSESGKLFSGRDRSSKSPRILTREDVRQLSIGKPVEIFFALADITDIHQPGVWTIKDGVVSAVN